MSISISDTGRIYTLCLPPALSLVLSRFNLFEKYFLYFRNCFLIIHLFLGSKHRWYNGARRFVAALAGLPRTTLLDHALAPRFGTHIFNAPIHPLRGDQAVNAHTTRAPAPLQCGRCSDRLSPAAVELLNRVALEPRHA